ETSPYDNVGLQDHNRVLKADVTPSREFANSIPEGAGPQCCRPVAVLPGFGRTPLGLVPTPTTLVALLESLAG
ncbi:hypothetical protein ACFRQM_19265, partial [Streptomyces sp. NPDC056831]|uniref:hypothetical protein n=1 Tax=Streptomyces sp. NPDC056831 TaxID=3345954 RepID=UPI0036797FC6